MADLSEKDLKTVFADIKEEQLHSILHLLEMIDCPPDLRSLSIVLASLEYLFILYPTRISLLINLNTESIEEIFYIVESHKSKHYSLFNRGSQGKGWKSQRPIYSLLFMFRDHRTTDAARALLIFLEHYLNNEAQITNQNREEQSVRAFRLLFSDTLIRSECFKENNKEETARNLLVLRDRLKQQDSTDEISRFSVQINYLYQLEHFYKLEWTTRERHHRHTPKQIRGHYSRNKYELVTGSDHLITASLKDQQLSDELEQAGVTQSEDFPDITIVNSSSPPLPLQPYEKANNSVVKDKAKHWFNSNKVSIDIKRSHNLLPTSRTILQPHELAHLWKSLLTRSTAKIGGIEKYVIQTILLLTVLTGRDIDSVLSIKPTSTLNEVGFYLGDDTAFLIVAPTPTTLSFIQDDLILIEPPQSA